MGKKSKRREGGSKSPSRSGSRRASANDSPSPTNAAAGGFSKAPPQNSPPLNGNILQEAAEKANKTVNGQAKDAKETKDAATAAKGKPPRQAKDAKDTATAAKGKGPDAIQIPAIGKNKSILSEEELEVLNVLAEAKQTHLVEHWPDAGVDDAKKHEFIEQLKTLQRTVPGAGGLAGYTERARRLLADAKEGRNPLSGWTPNVPTGEALNPSTDRYSHMERIGLPNVKYACFVLVAGGLGERLGYSDIKLKLPVELCTSMCYLELYIKQILALQRRYGNGRKLPLAIMVSEDTYKGTLKLLEDHRYFGMPKEQLTLMKQEKVPAIKDNDGSFLLDEPGSYSIMTKPHGHGDVHSLLHSTDTASMWLKQGQRWVVFMQDTNGLALHTLPAALGVSAEMKLEVNSMAIPRKAKQAIGGIVRLRGEQGQEMTINVEYNQLDPLLRGTISPEGDVNDPKTGFSPFPGNINQLVFELEPYVKVLQATSGVLGEFVNPKYTDSTKTAFKKPTRLECMMQDYPKALGPKARVGFTSIEPSACFSPVKNSQDDALQAQAAGIHPACAATGEADAYGLWVNLLRILGCDVIKPSDLECYGGIKAPLVCPLVALDPNFAVCLSDLRVRFKTPNAVRITQRSALVVKGGSVVIEQLDLDGALVLEVEEGGTLTIKSLKVRNDGWEIVPLTTGEAAAAPEEIRMRGFNLLKRKGRVIKVKKGEERVIDENPAEKDRDCMMGFFSFFGFGKS